MFPFSNNSSPQRMLQRHQHIVYSFSNNTAIVLYTKCCRGSSIYLKYKMRLIVKEKKISLIVRELGAKQPLRCKDQKVSKCCASLHMFIVLTKNLRLGQNDQIEARFSQNKSNNGKCMVSIDIIDIQACTCIKKLPPFHIYKLQDDIRKKKKKTSAPKSTTVQVEGPPLIVLLTPASPY